MKLFHTAIAAPALTLAAAALAPALAVAQPGAQPGPPPPPPAGSAYVGYYGAPPAQAPNGGYMHGSGRLTLGASIGIGAMSSDDGPIECSGCDYNPAAAGIAMHVGGLITPRFALMLELQGNMQAVAENGAESTTLVQSAAMLAAQYWVTPRLWVKGGLGAAQLSYSFSNDFESQSQEIDSGGAVMAAVGFEILSAPNYSVDLEARALVGSYEATASQITAGHVGIGFNWF